MRLRKAGETLRARIPRQLRWEPWSVLVPLIVLQWAVVAHVARHARHNGWLFHHDATAALNYAAARTLGDGHIAGANTGYGLPFLFTPVTWITGPTFPDALHVILTIQILVLLPLGAIGAYVLGARSGGRLIGYLSALIWTLGPLASLRYFNGPRWLDQVLPTIAGLTELVYLPSMLAVLLAGVLVLRALDERRLVDAAAAGVATGFAIALEPANAFFLAAPFVAFAAARRGRELAVFGAALAPCLLTYALWRERGLGHFGTLSQALLLPTTGFTWSYNLSVKFGEMQTSTWSPRLLEWIAVAGFVGLLKRSPVKALFFGTWFAGYVVAGGMSRELVRDGIAFWHSWLPAFPAFCVLMASLPLLWPRSDRFLSERFVYRPRRIVPIAVPAAVALAAIVLPLGVVAAAPTLESSTTAVELPTGAMIPVDPALRFDARVEGARVGFSWKAPVLPVKVSYAIYRTRGKDMQCTRGRGATRCGLTSERVATTRSTTFSERLPKGTITYRVAVIASELGNGSLGSAVAISPPVTVHTA